MKNGRLRIGNLISLIIFIIAVIFLVLITKNKGDFALTLSEMMFWK